MLASVTMAIVVRPLTQARPPLPSINAPPAGAVVNRFGVWNELTSTGIGAGEEEWTHRR
jgi:hypothetical protein